MPSSEVGSLIQEFWNNFFVFGKVTSSILRRCLYHSCNEVFTSAALIFVSRCTAIVLQQLQKKAKKLRASNSPGVYMSSLSEITSLQKTLNAALDAFKAELAAQNLPEPSLNTSKPHPIDEITYLPTPAMYEARRVALASLVGLDSFHCYLKFCSGS